MEWIGSDARSFFKTKEDVSQVSYKSYICCILYVLIINPVIRKPLHLGDPKTHLGAAVFGCLLGGGEYPSRKSPEARREGIESFFGDRYKQEEGGLCED
jgi:hypothetical protein